MIPLARIAHARTARWGYPVGVVVAAATAIGLLVVALRSQYEPTTSRLSRFMWQQHQTTSAPEYTAAVVYLVSRDRMDVLPESLGKAQLHVAWRSQWPIILFHTGDFDSIQSQLDFYTALRKDKWSGKVYFELRNRIEFVKLGSEWILPPGVSPDIDIYKPEEYAHRWPGYHHMCRFFAQGIFQHPRIRLLTYYMRLDTDSFILDPLCYDPIDKVHRDRKVYAYNRVFTDEPYVVKKMWNFIDEYARAHPAIEERLRRNAWPWPEGRWTWAGSNETYNGVGVPSYYNNFEVVRLDAFQRSDAAAWIDAVMEDPSHIYSLRWGDAPIRYTTVSMFYDLDADVERICAMNYWHGEHVANSCPCVA